MIRKISVVAAIISRKNPQGELEFLLFRRSSGGSMNGLYEFPGGKLEPNELDREALKREIGEELGVPADVGEFYMQTLWRSSTHEILLKTYHVQLSSFDFQLTDHDDFQWFSRANLPWEQIAKPDIPILQALFQVLEIP